MTAPVRLLALFGDLQVRLAAGDPDVVRSLETLAGTTAGALVLGAEGRSARHDPAALATKLTVGLPGWPVLAVSDGRGDHPYNAARRFLSLDHLSRGRAGVVFRGDGEAAGYTAERIRVIRALWNSWPLESLVADRGTGVYAEVGGIRAIDHQGEDFRVYGALNSPASIQGEPVSLWHVTTAAELDAAHGLVDLVVVDDPALLDRWSQSAPEGRPGLVTQGVKHNGGATACLVPVHSTGELLEAVAGLPSAVPGAAAPTLRAVLGLPARSYDLTDKPFAFGASRA